MSMLDIWLTIAEVLQVGQACIGAFGLNLKSRTAAGGALKVDFRVKFSVEFGDSLGSKQCTNKLVIIWETICTLSV
jgi:hypothetical protein